MNRFSAFFRRLGWLTLGLGCTLTGLAQQQPAKSAANRPLSEVLNPDGTMRRGQQGSFDATGYQLSTNPSGQPSFRSTAAGDDDWSGRFADPAALNGSVRTVAVAANGDFVVGGLFTDAGGNADADRIARWDGSAWQSLGTGLSAQVNSIVIASNGDVIAGGQFTDAGGIASADYVARWNGSAWQPLGTGTNGEVRSVVINAGGNIVAGGNFTLAGGVAGTSRIARWNGSNWFAYGTGMSGGGVLALAVSGADVIAGGLFTSAGGVANTLRIARWDGTAWQAMGTGADNTVNAIALTSTSNILIGGDFTLVSGVANTRNIARWTGSAWQPLGTGTNERVRAVAVLPLVAGNPNNPIVAGGTFTAVGDGSKVMQRFGIYNTPVNQAPVVANQTFTIDENRPVNALAGTIVATDADAGTTLTYTLVSGNVNGAFTLVGNQLRVANSGALDFETTPTFTLAVRVSDGTLVSNATITVNLNDLPESLTVSTVRPVPAGNYSNITVTGTGAATLTGNVSVTGTLLVQDGGSLADGCFVVTGNRFELAAGATLSTCNAAGITASGATGAVQTTTRVLSSDASYVYNGTATQGTGSGLPGQVRNLTVNNASGLTLSQAVSVRQVARLQTGDLTTNGQSFTLISVSGEPAALVDNVNGQVLGTATVQRAVDATNSSNIGYHHYSAPVSNTTLNDLANPGFVPVFNPAYNTATNAGNVTPFPTVFGYDQSRVGGPLATDQTAFNQGWVAPAAGTAMNIGQGYTVHASNATVVDFNGLLNNGPVNITNLNRSAAADAGWQLLGNPYPAPLDWGTVTAAQRTNLDAAMYVYNTTDTYAGTYRSYLANGATGTGPEALINSGAGFFVRVTTAGQPAALSLGNANRVTTYGAQPAFGRSATIRPLLQMQVRGTGGADELSIYADAHATTGLDAEYDAVKLRNPSGLNLAAVLGAQLLAINGLPDLGVTTATVPLSLGAPAPGTYTLTVSKLANFGSTRVYLRNAATGTEQELTTGTQVAIALQNVNVATTQFSLVFRRPATVTGTAAALAAETLLYPNPAHGSFTLQLPALAGATQSSAVLLNALGQPVRQQTIALTSAGATQEINVAGLAAGVYSLQIKAGAALITKRVVLD